MDPRRIALRAALPVLMLSAYLVLPHHLDAFEAMSISPRLVPLFVLAVVATLPQLALRDGARVALERVAAAGLATYAIVLTSRYAAYGAEVDALATVIRAVPAGERVVGLIESGESSVMNVESILRAVPSAYVSLRADRRSMVPLRYCGMRHIPCARTPSADALPETNPWRPEAFDARAPGNVFTFAITDRPIVGGALAGRRVSTVAHRGRFTAVRFE